MHGSYQANCSQAHWWQGKSDLQALCVLYTSTNLFSSCNPPPPPPHATTKSCAIIVFQIGIVESIFFADFDADFLYTGGATQEKVFLKILKKNSKIWPSYKLSKFDGQAIFCPIQCTVRDPRPWHKLSETASPATHRAAYIGPPDHRRR